MKDSDHGDTPVSLQIIPFRITGRFLVLLVLLLPLQACYHYRVVVPEPDPATEYEARTLHSFFWGLIQEDVTTQDCLSNALDEVRVTSSPIFAIATVATLGVWSPMLIQWRCAKEPVEEGEI